ncbi:MAG: flagellin FliC5 [Lachnospiraceae bacterium]|nr:flagellin FliC5 [Lachnospiraceae bacterium]
MSGISSIGGSMNTNIYSQLASGRRINSAADGAAETSIINKEDAQIKGLEAGASNIKSAQDLLKVADGGVGRITDSLQRMRELAVYASNDAVLSNSDKRAIQDEIDQLKQGISEISEQTSFNTKKLLDGNAEDLKVATDSNGNAQSMSVGSATLKSLGIEDFDVTKDFNIAAIDEALSKISENRSNIGAQSNSLDYAFMSNSQTSYDITSAKSRTEDLDYPQAVSEKKKQETLQAYALMAQKKKEEEEERKMQNFFTQSAM